MVQLKFLLNLLYLRLLRPILARVLAYPFFSISRTELREASQELFSYGSAEIFQPRPSLGPEPIPTEIKLRSRELMAPAPFVCELTGIDIIGKEGIAVTPKNRYILEEVEGDAGLLADVLMKSLYHGTLPIRHRSAFAYESRPAAILLEQGSDGYYHWMAEYLPRVAGLECYSKQTGVFPDVFIDEDGPDWKRASLLLAGVPEGRIVEWDGTRVRFDRFVVPALPVHYPREGNQMAKFSSSPAAMRWVSKRLRSRIGVESDPTRRVLITRRNAPTRRMVNEEAVIETLGKYGFEAHTLDELSVEEQVRLFAQTEVVVGPHGAGMINCMFGEDIKILELFGGHESGVYYSMAGALGFDHGYLWCEDVNDDLMVDTDALETQLQALLNSNFTRFA